MSDCCVCIGYDVDGSCDFFESRTVKARKDQRCCECRSVIHAGDKYEYAAGKYDGDFFTAKTCLFCDSVRDAFACGGSVAYGELWQEMRDYAFPAMTTGCLQKLQPEHRGELVRKWQQWKGLAS
jgi:hypothetical protein